MTRRAYFLVRCLKRESAVSRNFCTAVWHFWLPRSGAMVLLPFPLSTFLCIFCVGSRRWPSATKQAGGTSNQRPIAQAGSQSVESPVKIRKGIDFPLSILSFGDTLGKMKRLAQRILKRCGYQLVNLEYRQRGIKGLII